MTDDREQMSEADNALDFIFAGETLRLRTVRRKGELRYIASNQRGSLKALTQFAPPSKSIPRLVLKMCSFVDFRIPRVVETIDISGEFLRQSADLLGISVEQVGIYVGEPDDQRKLVVTDIFSESNFVLKIAVGITANEAIRREAESGRLALGIGRWEGLVPDMRRCEPVCGRPAILIERIRGKQLTPDEFEKAFFGEGAGHWALGIGEIPDKGTEKVVTVGEWLDEQGFGRQALGVGDSVLKNLLERCEIAGALSLRSPVGVVHGDFAPWNIVQRAMPNDRRRRSEDGKSQTTNNPSTTNFQSRLCAIDWEFSRADTPLIFDHAYAARCYDVLLERKIRGIDPKLWRQLVALGELWFELRKTCQ